MKKIPRKGGSKGVVTEGHAYKLEKRIIVIGIQGRLASEVKNWSPGGKQKRRSREYISTCL